LKSAEDSPTKPSTASSVEGIPSSRTSRPYVGWIPTVNGRLSFRHVGDTRRPTESIFANIDAGPERVIIAYQRRPLSDILFPRIIHWTQDISGDFWFTLTAKSNNSPLLADRITGKIHVFKSREDWRDLADQTLRAAIRNLGRLRFSGQTDVPAQANLEFDRARQLVEQYADIEIEFDLERDGEVAFSQPTFKEAALQRASEQFAANDGHNIRKWVADQCYFFLRDSAHAHQHHEPTSDTILILQDRGQDDIQWRKNVIYSLHYAIIRFKRDPDARSALRAMGILAYCKSFIDCCKAKLGDNYEGFPAFNDDALLLSLQAKANEISVAEQIIANRQGTSLAKAAASRTIVLAFVAIVVATVAILIQPRISNDDRANFPLLFQVSTFAAENFFNFLAASTIVIAVTWITTAFNMAVDNRRLGRSLLEATYVAKRSAIAGFFLGALVVVGGTLWLFKPAVISLIETLKDFFELFVAS
jgi:preprotein translocase subunit SecG